MEKKRDNSHPVLPALHRDTEPGEILQSIHIVFTVFTEYSQRSCLSLTSQEEKSKAASLPRIKTQLGSN